MGERLIRKLLADPAGAIPGHPDLTVLNAFRSWGLPLSWGLTTTPNEKMVWVAAGAGVSHICPWLIGIIDILFD